MSNSNFSLRITLASCLIIFFINSRGQEREPKWLTENTHQKGTLGEILQSSFKDHCATCFNKNFNGSKRNFIFNDISDNRMDLSTKAVKVQTDLYNLFLYAFKKRELEDTVSLIRINNDKILDIKETDIASRVLLLKESKGDGFSSYIIDFDCGKYLSFLLNNKVAVPTTEIKAALDANRQFKSKLVIASGTFTSPLTSLFSKVNENSIRAYLSLWELYRTNPDMIDSAVYLSNFSGITTYNETGISKNLKVTSAITTGFAAGVYQGNGAITDNIDVVNTFNFRRWNSYVFLNDKSKLQAFTKNFPSIQDIKGIFRSQLDNTSTSFTKDLPDFVKNSTNTHIIEFKGIPESYCSARSWRADSVTTGIYKGPLSVESTYSQEKGVDICTCKISGIPQDSLFKSAGSSFPVKYFLVHNKKITDNELKIEITRNIVVSGDPRLAFLKDKPIEMVKVDKSNGKFTPKWIIHFRLFDKNNTLVQLANIANINDETLIKLVDESVQLLSTEKKDIVLHAKLIFDDVDKSNINLEVTFEELYDSVNDVEVGREKQNFSFSVKIKSRNDNSMKILTVNQIPLEIPIYKNISSNPE